MQTPRFGLNKPGLRKLAVVILNPANIRLAESGDFAASDAVAVGQGISQSLGSGLAAVILHGQQLAHG